MTPKQIRFVDEYMIDLNATQAAKRAGYSEKTAYSQGQRALKDVEIKAEIEKRAESMQNSKIVSAEEIMEYLSRVVSGEESEEVITATGRAMKKVGAKDRIKAAELMAKRYALFVDKSDITVNTSEKLSDVIGQLGGGGGLDE